MRRFLTGALEEVAKKSGLSEAFLGLIVLPIAGNACEHITAVFVAVKDKMDLAIGVALGSSIQVGGSACCALLPVHMRAHMRAHAHRHASERTRARTHVRARIHL